MVPLAKYGSLLYNKVSPLVLDEGTSRAGDLKSDTGTSILELVCRTKQNKGNPVLSRIIYDSKFNSPNLL